MLSKPKPGRQGVSRVEIGSGNRLVASDTETFTYDVRDQLSARRDYASARDRANVSGTSRSDFRADQDSLELQTRAPIL